MPRARGRPAIFPKSKLATGSLFLRCLDLFKQTCVFKGNSPAGIKTRVHHFELFAAWCQDSGLASPSDVSRLMFFTWIESLKYSPNTKRVIVLNVRYILRLAWEERLLDIKPEICRVPIPKGVSVTRQVLSSAEIRQVHKYLYANPRASRRMIRWRVFFNLALLGLRLSEMCLLRWSDIHGNTFTIKVKGGKIRSFFIDEMCRQALTLWAEVQDVASDYLFSTAPGAVPSPSSVAHAFRTFLKLSGVKRGAYSSTHLWRHSVATLLWKQTRDIDEVKCFLGHAQRATTEGYIHVEGQHMADSLEKIKSVLKGGDDDV